MEASSDQSAPPKRNACQGCHAIKMRCVEAPPQNGKHACARCLRLKIPCEERTLGVRGRRPGSTSKSSHASRRASETPSEQKVEANENEPMLSQDSNPNLPLSWSSTSRPLFTHPVVSYAGQSSSITSTSSINGINGTPPVMYPPSHSAGHSSHSPMLNPTPLASTSNGSHPSPNRMPPPYPNGPSPVSTGSHNSRASFSGAAGGADRSHMPSPPIPGSSRSQNYDQPALSFVEAAEAKSAAASKLPAPARVVTQPLYPDPVDMRILGLLEAELLFNQFYDHLNALIKLFDRYLHTAAYMRATSTVCYTAILAASAKFFRPDLYPALLSHAQQLVARALAETLSDIGAIQAICVLVYWKEPSDRSAWMRVGWAIRMGFQLKLNIVRSQPLPDDQFEARMILARERLWLNLLCFDSSYRLNQDYTECPMLPGKDTTVLNKWLEESLTYEIWEDHFLAASVESGKVVRLINILERSSPESGAITLAKYIAEYLDSLHARYHNPDCPAMRMLGNNGPSHFKQLLSFHNNSVNLARAALIANHFQGDLLYADFIVRASQLVATVEAAAAVEGGMERLQDSTAVMLFNFGEFLAKLFHIVGPGSTQSTVVKFLTQVYVACNNCSGDKEDRSPAFIARFYRLLLQHVVSNISRPPTRAPSPQAANGNQPQQPTEQPPNPFAPFGYMENDLYFQLSNDTTAMTSTAADTNYWESLFPDISEETLSFLDSAQFALT